MVWESLLQHECESPAYVKSTTKIMADSKDESLPPQRGGMWGWLLLIVSTAFAMPNSMTEVEAPFTRDKAPQSVGSFFTLKWMNPLRWIPSFSISRSDPSPPSSSTTYLDAVDLALHHGYPAERHFVTTEDGYILGLHRLPSGRKIKTEDKNERTPRPVVLVHHAFLTTSREFFILGPQKALAFILADAGFDVWLTNARGNTYSRNHTTLDPNHREFWNFSYQEHGIYDLPAVIDYVLKESGRNKLHYLGHSMGTTAFLIMSSERPEMLSKIISFSAMGPVTSTANCRSKSLRLLMSAIYYGGAFLNRIGMYEFLRHYKWLTTAGQTICNNGRMTQKLCTGILSALAGRSTTMDLRIIPEMLAHTPAGTSIKTLEHFAQNYRTGFRKFDYGHKENEVRYNSNTPPTYNLKAANIPTQMFYGMNDLMADYTEALYLCKMLPNVFKCERVPEDTFSHLDFIWSDKAHTLVYPSILEGIKKLEYMNANQTMKP